MLFAVMLLISLSGTLTVATFSLFQQQSLVKHQAKKILGEKQVLSLAKYTFKKLKQISSDNNIISCRKGRHFHFYETSENEPYVTDLGILDQESEAKDWSIMVLPIYDTAQPACSFQGDGCRIPLHQAINDRTFFDMQQELVKQRWSALQQKPEIPLPIHLFFPFVQIIDWSSNALHIMLWNPYDRSLSGYVTLALTIVVEEHGTRREEPQDQSFLNINILPGKTQTLTVHLLPGSQELRFSLCDLKFHVLRPGQYQIKAFNLNQNLWNKDHTLTQQRHTTPWARKPATQPSTDLGFWSTSYPLYNYQILCPTVNWNEQLNACLFFQDGTPYHKVGNFYATHKYIQELNYSLWNKTVPQPQMRPFWFNGERSLLSRDLSEFLHKKKEAVSDEVDKIIGAQPFPDAYSFVKWAQASLSLPIEFFSHLHARTEVFEIFVQKTTAEHVYTCKMKVERNISTHKWHKIYTHLCSGPLKKIKERIERVPLKPFKDV